VKRNNWLRVLIAGTLLVLCIWFIWSNSLLDAYASGLRSQAVAQFIARELAKVLGPRSPIVRFVLLNIRKIAHAVEFFVLGALSALMLIVLRRTSVHMILHAVLLCLFVAVADESIQIFTGRGAMVQDILLDFGASLAGMLVMAAVWGIVLRIGRMFQTE